MGKFVETEKKNGRGKTMRKAARHQKYNRFM
jgi:hypothetical protein